MWAPSKTSFVIQAKPRNFSVTEAAMKLISIFAG
jgi:hypothetical protein